MTEIFCLLPRYRFGDDSPWLLGIDPCRHYWICVNGERNLPVAIPGLTVAGVAPFKQIIFHFRNLQPGEQMTVQRIVGSCKIHCIAANLYAIESEIDGAAVWHLFDRETLESLLMTAHPDWECSPKDMELVREILSRSFHVSVTA